MEVICLTEVDQLKFRFQMCINSVSILSLWQLQNSLSCDSRYVWYDSRYILFRLLPGSSLAVFPGFPNAYFFLIRHAFSCLLSWWLNGYLTESEENTYLCACICLMLFDSWFTACLKDFFSLSSYTLSSYTTLHLHMLRFFWHNVVLVLFSV